MNVLKTITAFAAGIAFLLAGAFASDFGPQPISFEAEAESYIASRLEDPRGARFDFNGEPYQVFADIGSYEGVPAWAIDVRVKSRMASGSFGGYLPYTVIFVGGDPVALEEDTRQLTRL